MFHIHIPIPVLEGGSFFPWKSTWRELIILSLVVVCGEGQESQAGESL